MIRFIPRPVRAGVTQLILSMAPLLAGGCQPQPREIPSAQDATTGDKCGEIVQTCLSRYKKHSDLQLFWDGFPEFATKIEKLPYDPTKRKLESLLLECPMDIPLQLQDINDPILCTKERLYHVAIVKFLSLIYSRHVDESQQYSKAVLHLIAQQDPSPICRGDALLAISGSPLIGTDELIILISALRDEGIGLHGEKISEFACSILREWVGDNPSFETEEALKAGRSYSAWRVWFDQNRSKMRFIRASNGQRVTLEK